MTPDQGAVAPPGGFEPPTCDLGTRRSGQVFDQVKPSDADRLATLFPKPSHDHRSLAVYDSKLPGGDHSWRDRCGWSRCTGFRTAVPPCKRSCPGWCATRSTAGIAASRFDKSRGRALSRSAVTGCSRRRPVRRDGRRAGVVQTPLRDVRVHAWSRRWLAEHWQEWQTRTRASATEALARFITIAVEHGAKTPEGRWRRRLRRQRLRRRSPGFGTDRCRSLRSRRRAGCGRRL